MRVATRPSRSEHTRASILAAARERFASDGYERATIRAIAADARIDPALVMRYYGNKEGLFVAAAKFDLRLPDLTTLPRKAVGTTLIEHFLQRWGQDDVLKALLRTAATNELAAAHTRTILTTQTIPAIAAVCPAPRTTAALRAGLVTSQVLGFALCRYILRLPPVVTMRPGEVVDSLGPVVQRYIFNDLSGI